MPDKRTDEIRLPLSPEAPSIARRSLDQAAAALPPPVRDDLALLVSELVTNSVRHSGANPDKAIELRLEWWPAGVRVEVADQGNGFAPPQGPLPAGRESGWGLHLVKQLADRWGLQCEHGTRVWFELQGTDGSSSQTGDR